MKSEKEEWMKIFYKECWRQYDHEDNLIHKRNVLFISIQGLFISVLSIGPILNGTNIFTESVIYTIMLLFLSIVSIVLITYWHRLTKAGKFYVDLRFKSTKNIEEYLQNNDIEIKEFGLAINEHEARKVHVVPNSKYAGSIISTKAIIFAMYSFWILAAVLGVILLCAMNVHYCCW